MDKDIILYMSLLWTIILVALSGIVGGLLIKIAVGILSERTLDQPTLILVALLLIAGALIIFLLGISKIKKIIKFLKKS